MKNLSSPQQPKPSRPTVSNTREPLPRFMTWPEVIIWSRLSRTTLRREIQARRFPAPETLSPGREAFRVDKLQKWQDGRRDWAADRP
jgi:predicted DNA-binding transcriptional regulator AlpA